ncbi:right-handed parallel beta-helix repeat-containing protein, partial [bacterium]|nr:right-handed parallel beta-helix repeat-containing protein [bacterium]
QTANLFTIASSTNNPLFVIGSDGQIVSSSTATSTFANGISLENGCFQTADGNCLSNSDTQVVVAASDSSATEKAAADYIADGTNDEEQIQDAIDYVYANGGGGTVHLLAGTYTVGTTTYTDRAINMATSTRLVGQGAGSTIIKFASGFSGAVDLVAIRNVEYVHLEGFTLDGNASVSNGDTLVYSSSANNIVIDGVNVINSDEIGFYLNGVASSTIRNGLLNNISQGGIDIDGGTHDILIENMVLTDTGGAGIIEGFSAARVTVRDNSFEDTVTASLYLWSQTPDWIVSGNTMINPGSEAVQLRWAGGENMLFENNKVVSAIMWSSDSNTNVQIINNHFSGATDALYTSGSNWVISGNTIEFDDWAGIYDQAVSTKIVDNRIVDSANLTDEVGIYLDGTGNTIVTGNHVTVTGASAYTIENWSDNVTLANNFLSGGLGISDNGTGTRYDEHNRNTLTTATERAYSIFSIAASSSSSTAEIANLGTGDLFNVYNSSGQQFTIDNSGNVGIGSTTPTHTLSVEGDLFVTGAIYDSVNNSAGTNGMVLQTTGTGFEWVSTTTLGLLAQNELGVTVQGYNANTSFFGTSVDESELNIVAAPTDGYVLQASSTSAGGFIWQATSSLGINGTADDLSDNVIDDLSNVVAAGAATGTLLVYDAGTSNWVVRATSTLNINTDDLTEGTNQFYSNDLVSSYIAGSSSIPSLDGTATGDLFVWNGSSWAPVATNTLNVDAVLLAGQTGGYYLDASNLVLEGTDDWTGLFDGREGTDFLRSDIANATATITDLTFTTATGTTLVLGTDTITDFTG